MLTVKFIAFPILNTPRLTLRALTLDDKADMFAMRTNNEVMKYAGREMPQSETEVEEWINTINAGFACNKLIVWAITLKGDNHAIGTIGFSQIDTKTHRAEIGYSLMPPYQQKGLMSEALQEVIKYGFHEMKLHAVEANVNPENQASVKLLEKNGFEREAYFKANYYFNGRFIDSAIYSLFTPIS